METEAETGGRRPLAQGRTPGAPRSWTRRGGPSPGASAGSPALGHPDLRHLVSRTQGRYTSSLSVVLNHLICGHLEQLIVTFYNRVLPKGSTGKESGGDKGDPRSIPGWERSPGGGNGNPLQYSALENPMACIGHGVTKSQTRLGNVHFQSMFITSGSTHCRVRLHWPPDR